MPHHGQVKGEGPPLCWGYDPDLYFGFPRLTKNPFPSSSRLWGMKMGMALVVQNGEVVFSTSVKSERDRFVEIVGKAGVVKETVEHDAITGREKHWTVKAKGSVFEPRSLSLKRAA